MIDRNLPPGWRIVDLDPERAKEHLRYVELRAKELAAIPRVKVEAPKPPAHATKEELEQFYFEQQCESTKAAILRQRERKPSEDIEYLLRPIPACVANPEAKTLDELTSKRQLDASEVMLHMGTKFGRNAQGQSAASSAENRREQAVNAFTYSKPAELSDADFKRITKSEPTGAIMASEPEPEKLPLDSFSFRLSCWLHKVTGVWWW